MRTLYNCLFLFSCHLFSTKFMILKYFSVVYFVDETPLKTGFPIGRVMAVACGVCWECQVAQLSIWVLG